VHHSAWARDQLQLLGDLFLVGPAERSLRLNVGQRDIVIGVPGYLRPGDNRILPMLALPFAQQRPYWRWPAARRAPVEVARDAGIAGMMAE